jgi:hypothetical protein
MEIRLVGRQIAIAVLHSLTVRGILLRDVEYQVQITSTKVGDGEEATTTFEVVIRPQPEEPNR